MIMQKDLQDYQDTNFVELFRVNEGQTKKLQDASTYSEIKKYFATRTFDESGNYAVEPFRVTTQDAFNDEVGSGGKIITRQGLC